MFAHNQGTLTQLFLKEFQHINFGFCWLIWTLFTIIVIKQLLFLHVINNSSILVISHLFVNVIVLATQECLCLTEMHRQVLSFEVVIMFLEGIIQLAYVVLAEIRW